MQPNVLSILLSVLTGAITVSIPKFWEILLEKFKHKQSVEKLYFERKLEVLQAFIVTCSQLTGSYFHNSFMFEKLKIKNFFGDQDFTEKIVIDNMGTQIKNSQEIIKKVEDLANAVTMFIDLKEDPKEMFILIKSIHDDTSKIGNLNDEVDKIIKSYHLSTIPQSGTPGFEEYSLAINAYQSHLQKIADNYERARLKILEVIKEVRKDIKGFKI